MRHRKEVSRAAAAAAVVLSARVALAQYEVPNSIYDAPVSYYTGATGTGATLKSALNDIIDHHWTRNYSSQAVDALKILDQDPNNSANVLLVYSSTGPAGGPYTQTSVAKTQFPSGSANREHLWPNSYGINDDNPANSDLFNLRPADVN